MELYVHFPFCIHKCRYCDFTSYSGLESRMPEYLDALLDEASLREHEAEEPIETVYFGGGTPSLFPPRLMKALAEGLRQRLPLEGVTEWSVEANPGTVSPSWLSAALEAGITRLSLGMQARQDEILQTLGRIHRFEELENSVLAARRAGFENISLDLIFGVPGQSISDWEGSLTSALDLRPEHLSAYGLIPETGTPLFEDLRTGRLTLPDEDEERQMYEILLQMTRERGFCQYEISNFSRPGYECRHNIGYWNQTPYIGLGTAAASMVKKRIGPEGMQYLRKINTGRFDDYLAGVKNRAPILTEQEQISPAESRFETMMLGLRMNQGVSEKRFQSQHGISLECCYGEKLRSLRSLGLMDREAGAWKLTRKGMDIQNMVLVELME